MYKTLFWSILSQNVRIMKIARPSLSDHNDCNIKGDLNLFLDRVQQFVWKKRNSQSPSGSTINSYDRNCEISKSDPQNILYARDRGKRRRVSRRLKRDSVPLKNWSRNIPCQDNVFAFDMQMNVQRKKTHVQTNSRMFLIT